MLFRTLSPKRVPSLNPNQYWGPGKRPEKFDNAIRPFKINVPEEELIDLKWRLDHVRPLVPPLEGVQQQYGINTNLLKTVLEFWRTEYDWRERETLLNRYPQYKTNIQGLDIHYLHVKPENPEGKPVLPLIIVHGWPGSVREFYDIIPLLTGEGGGRGGGTTSKRDFLFEVIAPHIPGYGFSQAAAKPGLDGTRVAVIMNNLMNRLGFEQYYCQGGDFGAIILQCLSVLYPESVLGYHTNMPVINTPKANLKYLLGTIYPSRLVREDHRDRVFPLWKHAQRRILETGYMHIQATKPDTIGVGLTDSPAGLAAYILEKFTTGTNITWQTRDDGGLLEKYTYADLLDNVMIYWLTSSATTSFRLYAETLSRASLREGMLRQPLKVPTSITRMRYDFYVADGIIKEIFPNNLQLTDYEAGHFAAWEAPDILAEDIFSSVNKFIKYNADRIK